MLRVDALGLASLQQLCDGGDEPFATTRRAEAFHLKLLGPAKAVLLVVACRACPLALTYPGSICEVRLEKFLCQSSRWLDASRVKDVGDSPALFDTPYDNFKKPLSDLSILIDFHREMGI